MRKTSNKINKDEAGRVSAKENERKTKARFTKNRITNFIRKTANMNNNNNNNKDSDSDEDKDLFGLNSSKKKNQFI